MYWAIVVGVALYVVFVLAVGKFLSLGGWHDQPEEPLTENRE